jgi:hypothetical protein
MKKFKVGILTTFSSLDPAFSLATVVRQQVTALLRSGVIPVLFCLPSFKEENLPEGLEVRNIIPQFLLEPYTHGNLDNLEEESNKAKEAMEENMQDIDVCLTHDIIFINSYLPYNIGMRKAIDGKLSKVRWLHWMHSGPSIRPQMDGSPYDMLYTLPKNSKLVYMNYTDVVRAAEMYGVFPKDVRTIFNPMDIRELYDFKPITRELIDANDLMKPEFLCVYPLSTTRMDQAGKQLSKVIWIMSYLKKKGFSITLIVPNAHANAKKEKDAIEKMYEFAYAHGMERRELIFTSLHNVPKNEHGVPHEVIRDLFLLGNLFIFPSVSENCPLVLLEAMAGKNILVLNQSFPAMRDFGAENALYFRFGSLVDDPQFPLGLEKYMEDVATLIISEYQNNKAIKAQTKLRREFNVDFVATHQLLPAIHEIHAEV